MRTYRKKRRSYKRRKTRRTKMRGGSFNPNWVGIPNPNQPTGFGWLNETFLFPCRKSY